MAWNGKSLEYDFWKLAQRSYGNCTTKGPVSSYGNCTPSDHNASERTHEQCKT
jgi:hypothetical protein